MKIFEHFLLTRFNVAQGYKTPRLDKSWLKHRFKLFDSFCFPSVMGQTCRDFKWIVLFDIDTSQFFKDKIEKYSKWSNFIPVYQEKFSIPRQAILNNLSSNPEYLITTRLDNDDAIRRDFIEIIQQHFNNQNFIFFNFTNGYVWSNHGICLVKQASNPFISLIEHIDEFRTVWCGQHNKLTEVGPVVEIKSEPAWIQVVHERNLTNAVRGELQPPSKVWCLGRDFGIKKNLFLSYCFGVASNFARPAKRLIRESISLFKRR